MIERALLPAGRSLKGSVGRSGISSRFAGTIFPGNWDFVLRAIYKGRYPTTDETQFFFNWEYLNEAMKKISPRRADQIGFYIEGLKDPDRAAEVAAAIDASFKNSITETLTETEKAFQLGFVSMTEAIVIAIQLVSFVVIIIIMAVVANTMAMSARERTGEYAIFKTIGFGKWHIAGLIFGESFFITMTGCALGILATFPAAKAFGDAMSAFLPIFHVSKQTIYLDIVAAVIVAVVRSYHTDLSFRKYPHRRRSQEDHLDENSGLIQLPQPLDTPPYHSLYSLRHGAGGIRLRLDPHALRRPEKDPRGNRFL